MTMLSLKEVGRPPRDVKLRAGDGASVIWY